MLTLVQLTTTMGELKRRSKDVERWTVWDKKVIARQNLHDETVIPSAKLSAKPSAFRGK